MGILVTTFGKVTSAGAGVFYLTDGSGAAVLVNAAASASLPAVDDYVAVTGICRLEPVGGGYAPCLTIRQTSDWRKVD